MRSLWKGARSLALGLGVLAVAATSVAGTVVGGQVFIDTVNQTFSGALGSALHSADATQFIGCYTTGTSVLCQARNAAGTLVSCSTSTPAHIEAMKAMGDDSRIFVRYNGGTCTSLIVYNYSYWESR